MDRILVTGGNGLVGTALRRTIPEAIYIDKYDYDLTREQDVAYMFRDIHPTRVIHLAALVGGITDNIDRPVQYLEENVLMNVFMLRYAKLFKVERFLGLLSSCIFPDKSDHYPLKEEDMHNGAPTSTNFAYAMAKRMLGTQIDSYNQQYGTKYNYIIPCNLYGISEKTDPKRSHFIAALVRKIYDANWKGESDITLYGDGTPMRQFMYVNDMARVIRIIVDKDITESFNVAPDENLSIFDIANIARIATTSAHLRIRWDKTKPNGQMRKDLDNTKFKRLIPGFRFTPLSEGIAEYYNNYKE